MNRRWQLKAEKHPRCNDRVRVRSHSHRHEAICADKQTYVVAQRKQYKASLFLASLHIPRSQNLQQELVLTALWHELRCCDRHGRVSTPERNHVAPVDDVRARVCATTSAWHCVIRLSTAMPMPTGAIRFWTAGYAII